ncbi:hypothetical protein [Lactobacillus helveticus]|uniref:hypothetical protein n=1 Tax=Lactobacillus helveticus TaxID=1587 RepID=UPI001A9C4671|nr:hypothetical protein [Lactobacillus helveticus]NHL94341.1 hypothetical protein [Lactobacillus helveticus]
MDTKEAAKIVKSIAEYIKITGGKTMEVTIDVYTYDQLKDYCRQMNEPMSVIATKAIKKYIDASDSDSVNSMIASD